MKPLIVANWKMNETSTEAGVLLSELEKYLSALENSVEIVICPPFTALQTLGENPGFEKGAQDIHWEDKGTFTGEVSGPMLKDLGCKYVIVGHSERRWKLGESNEVVNLKMRAALRNDLVPILCVGERADERRAELTEQVLTEQLTEAWREIGRDDINEVVISYEPVWAIGTGEVKSREAATPEIVQAAYEVISSFLAAQEISDKTRLIYGGSIDSDNVISFLKVDSNQGFLVGGASLVPAEFSKIIKKVSQNSN